MTDDIMVLSLKDREQWEAAHRDDGLPSQSWSYAYGLSASGFDSRLAVVRSKGARMLIPFYERTFMETTDIATIPGLSGASVTPNSSAPLALWREYAASRGWVAGYMKLATSADLRELPPESRLIEYNAAFIVDLRPDDPLKAVSRTVHRKIQEAERNGAVVVTGAALADSLVNLYPGTMRRLGGVEEFSAETLRRWARDSETVLIGVSLGGVVHAVHMGYVSGRNAEWHVAATTEEGRSLGTLIYWHAITLLKSRDVHFYNMGGGGRVGDGLYRFKSWFGGTPLPLRAVQQIYDSNKYRELCLLTGEGADQGWFPAYHAPAAAAPTRGRFQSFA